MSPRIVAMVVVAAGTLLGSIGVTLVYAPAGLIVAGAALVLTGLFLVDVEGARESRSARPKRPQGH